MHFGANIRSVRVGQPYSALFGIRPCSTILNVPKTTVSLGPYCIFEGPATAKLQIDEASPGARELAQALDAKIEGGYYDALALAVFQAGEDDGHSDDNQDNF
jgi:hypothetical protein